MQWMAEPAQNTRVRVGVWVLLFLSLALVFVWRLNAVVLERRQVSVQNAGRRCLARPVLAEWVAASNPLFLIFRSLSP